MLTSDNTHGHDSFTLHNLHTRVKRSVDWENEDAKRAYEEIVNQAGHGGPQCPALQVSTAATWSQSSIIQEASVAHTRLSGPPDPRRHAVKVPVD